MRLTDLLKNPIATLNAAPRRRRCDVCRIRMTEKTYGWESGRHLAVHLYGSVAATYGPSSRPAYYLCADCRQENQQEEATETAAMRARNAASLAAMLQECRSWLREAPLVDQLPAPVDRFAENDVGPQHAFVELMDFEEAATHAAQGLLGFLPGAHFVLASGRKRLSVASGDALPDNYQAVLKHVQHDYLDSLVFTGSVYRWVDGRVVLHWHGRRWHISD